MTFTIPFLLCGIQDSRIQRRLLAEPDLTFGKAFELAQALESADRDAKTLLAVPPSVHAVTDSRNPQNRRSNSKKPDRPCYRCAGEDNIGTAIVASKTQNAGIAKRRDTSLALAGAGRHSQSPPVKITLDSQDSNELICLPTIETKTWRRQRRIQFIPYLTFQTDPPNLYNH